MQINNNNYNEDSNIVIDNNTYNKYNNTNNKYFPYIYIYMCVCVYMAI